MPSVLRIVHPDDWSRVLADLNDPTGEANSGVQTWSFAGGAFGLGVPEIERTGLATHLDGERTLYARAPLVASSWRMRVVAPTYSALREFCGRVGTLLRGGAVLEWRPDGDVEESRYIICHPSRGPAPLAGEPGELVGALRRYEAIVPIEVLRQPYLLGPLEQTAVSPAGGLMLVTGASGAPEGWAWEGGSVTGGGRAPTREAWQATFAATRTLVSPEVVVSGTEQRIGQAELAVAGSATGRVGLRWTDSGGGVLGTTWSPSFTLGPTPRRITVSGAPVGGATRVRLLLEFSAGAPAYMRAARIDVSSPRAFAALGDDDVTTPVGRVAAVYVSGDAPVDDATITITGVGGTLRGAIVGLRSAGGLIGANRLAGLLGRPNVIEAESGTLGTDTTAVSDTGASGGQAAQITFSTNNTLTPARVTLSGFSGDGFVDPAAPISGALLGGWRLMVRMRASVPGTNLHRVQAKHYVGTSGAAVNNDIMVIDLPITPYHTFDLGYIPPLTTQISIHAVRDTGIANLLIDHVWLVPADRFFTLFSTSGTANSISIRGTLATASTGSATIRGSLPVLEPGLNVFSVIPSATINDGELGNLGADYRDATIAISYRPRYAH